MKTNNLSTTELSITRDSNQLRGAFIAACENLTNYLKNGINGEEEMDHARLSSMVVASYSKLRSVEVHESGIKFAAAKIMANNIEEVKELVQKSIPEYLSA